MKTLLLCLSNFLVCALIHGAFTGSAQAERGDLDPLLGGEKLWQMSDADFAKKYIRKGDSRSFQWVSSAKESARLKNLRGRDGRSSKGVPTIGGGEHDVGEVTVRFKESRVNQVEFTMYARGDDGEIPQSEFEKRVGEMNSFINNRLEGVKGEERKDGTRLWRGKQEFFLLEHSFRKEDRSKGKRFRPEFIIVKVAPAPKTGRLDKVKRIKARSDLRKELVREDNGDYVIKTVPMVDQGEKGYCAVASAERVMRYYGLDVNQHEMAEISNTMSFGTSGKEMANALNAAAKKYHTRVLTLFEIDYSDKAGWREMEKTGRDYNRAAKKADKRHFKSDTIPIRLLLTYGDPEILKDVRASGTKYERFKSTVAKYVDDGLPVLWALCLGVFPEKGIPQTRGGHMRLIIGYNKKTQEILYSDSWGAGHEVKRMKMDEAYTMTEGMWILQPAH